ncbi:SRPBCC family protein [Nocardioides sp.]|uniref:SRPBCC family protein n=1 Tax=Nocardioides sp. TaxID=35761 RepID=UPI001A1CB468|nr:SRPBCC family protein [Nocardioides sp.]MBJ7359990.1 SRPBCC family protein [Nocardioides sp.]
MHVERTFTVATPIEEVFDYLVDFEHTNEWDPGTIETRRISGDGGVGTKYHNESEFAGRKTELTYESVAQERPTRLQFRGTNKTATATDTLTFSPAGGGTQVHYRADFEFTFPISLVAPLVVKPKLGGIADETVEQMKRTLESLR